MARIIAAGALALAVLAALLGPGVGAAQAEHHGGVYQLGAGPGGEPRVHSVLDDPRHPETNPSMLAFPAEFRGGARVATGYINDQGGTSEGAEIVAGAGPGGGPHVKVFNDAGQVLSSFFAYGSGFSGGVMVAAGDLDGDGWDEVITGAGAGGGPHVKVFAPESLQASQAQPTRMVEVTARFAYGSTFAGGVSVGAGDLDGDGDDEMITGAGPGGGPHVRVFDLDDNGDLELAAEFFAYGSGFAGGVEVAAADVDGDGADEIVTGAGPGGGPHVKVFGFDDTLGHFAPVASFFAYSGEFRGGVHVAGGNLGTPPEEVVTGAGPGGGPHVRTFALADGFRGDTGFFAFAPAFSGGVWVAVRPSSRDIPATTTTTTASTTTTAPTTTSSVP